MSITTPMGIRAESLSSCLTGLEMIPVSRYLCVTACILHLCGLNVYIVFYSGWTMIFLGTWMSGRHMWMGYRGSKRVRRRWCFWAMKPSLAYELQVSTYVHAYSVIPITLCKEHWYKTARELNLGMRQDGKPCNDIYTCVCFFLNPYSQVLHRIGTIPIHTARCLLLFEPADMPGPTRKILWVSASEGWHTR